MEGQRQKPTEAEWEVLQILWQNGPSTVRHVNDILNAKRRVGYTTTLKIMQIMAEKDMLARDESGRSHIYAPLLEERETQNVLLDRMLDTAFGGSALKLVMRALGSKKASKEELKAVRAYLDRIEREGEAP